MPLDSELKAVLDIPENPWIDQVRQFKKLRMLAELALFPSPAKAEASAEDIGLVTEEARELCKALVAEDLSKICDAACDLIYICIGVGLRRGIDLTPHFAEVHRANMEKKPAVEDGFGRMAVGGGPTKGPDWMPPRCADLLYFQMVLAAAKDTSTDGSD